MANGIRRLICTIEFALQVRRERRLLRGMSERMLKDIGLWGIADAEASRLFWDLPLARLPFETTYQCGCENDMKYKDGA